jgi:hypothetical protein
MKITLTYEVGDVVNVKLPAGPMKFSKTIGFIDSITQRWDEENDMEQTVFAINVNGTLYNVAYMQITGVATDENHEHEFEHLCKTCGAPELDGYYR